MDAHARSELNRQMGIATGKSDERTRKNAANQAIEICVNAKDWKELELVMRNRKLPSESIARAGMELVGLLAAIESHNLYNADELCRISTDGSNVQYEVRIAAGNCAIELFEKHAKKSDLERVSAERKNPEEIQKSAGIKVVGLYYADEDQKALIRIAGDRNFPIEIQNLASENAIAVCTVKKLAWQLSEVAMDYKYPEDMRLSAGRAEIDWALAATDFGEVMLLFFSIGRITRAQYLERMGRDARYLEQVRVEAGIELAEELVQTDSRYQLRTLSREPALPIEVRTVLGERAIRMFTGRNESAALFEMACDSLFDAPVREVAGRKAVEIVYRNGRESDLLYVSINQMHLDEVRIFAGLRGLELYLRRNRGAESISRDDRYPMPVRDAAERKSTNYIYNPLASGTLMESLEFSSRPVRVGGRMTTVGKVLTR